jgi:drug/metabolite transporter (DMT)-like permease
MGLLSNAIPFSLIAWGQTQIDAGLSAFINGSTAIFDVLVAATLFADERLTTNRLVGVCLGFIGVATAVGLSALRHFDLTALAQIAVIGASLSYALAGAWARAQFSTISPQMAAAGMTTFSSLFMTPVALAIEGAPALDYSPLVWAALAYMSVFGTALAYLLYYRVLNTAGSGNLLLVTLLIPPVAILLGNVALGEVLHPRAFIGFAVLAVGMLILDGRVLRTIRSAP